MQGQCDKIEASDHVQPHPTHPHTTTPPHYYTQRLCRKTQRCRHNWQPSQICVFSLSSCWIQSLCFTLTPLLCTSPTFSHGIPPLALFPSAPGSSNFPFWHFSQFQNALEEKEKTKRKRKYREDSPLKKRREIST